MTNLNKKCEVCEKEIPQDYVNLLCLDCYMNQVKDIESRKQEEEDAKRAITTTQPPTETLPQAPTLPQDESKPLPLISDPSYQENPEMADKDQVKANMDLFLRNGVLLWKPTRLMYEFIKNRMIQRVLAHPQYPKFIWKPLVVDVGCGSGVGSNVLSQEADFVWGIDKNELSIRFAKEAFSRIKNGIYYSSQISFDVFDIVNEGRETMKFDVVVAIEVIEHIADCEKFLEQIIKKFDNKTPNNPTEYYISTPNRNNKSISKDRPKNKYHVREMSSQEFHALLSRYFNEVNLFSAAGEPATLDTIHTPCLAICRNPKL